MVRSTVTVCLFSASSAMIAIAMDESIRVAITPPCAMASFRLVMLQVHREHSVARFDRLDLDSQQFCKWNVIERHER